MSDNSELFQKRITYLLSLRLGMERCYDVTPYQTGFLDACYIADTCDEPKDGFRRIVDAHQNGITDGKGDGYDDGFTHAIRLYQRAKGL